MIKQFKDYNSDIKEFCDVCVIGSGAGGAVAAKEIAEKGFSVVLLEEGGHHTSKTWSGKPLKGTIEMYRNGGSTLSIGNAFIPITLGKCIGGTTTINSATCFRTPEYILKKWQKDLGLENLTYKNLEHYFLRVEKEINVTELSWDILGNAAKVVKRGADRLGLKCRPLKHNVRDCRGCGTCQFGCIENAKQSTDVSYIPKAIKAGARVYAHCRADKLKISNKTVKGVTGSLINPETGKSVFSITVNAKIVIVSCGSLLTPPFLKKNRIRNRHIGRHLQIHPAGRVAALMDEKVEGWKGVSQGVYIHDFQNEGIILEGIFLHPSLMLATLPGIGNEFKELATQYPNIAAFGVMVHDSSTGRVLKGFSPGSFLAIYNMKRTDIKKLKKGIAETSRIFFAAGAKKVFTGVSKYPILNSIDDVDKFLKIKIKPNNFEILAFHPLGTCRMAATSKDGVVDQNGESFEIKNLYIADGSVVPTSLGVNPQITIMTLATMIAEGITKKIA